jgi:hypothetical protein
MKGKYLFILFAACLLGAIVLRYSASPEVDFNHEIRPILNEKCLRCHGGVKRAAGISFLFRSDALQPGKSGRTAIVPGKPSESELIKRIRHEDPDERMPRNEPALTEAEIEKLATWIENGAQWTEHWAYVAPVAETPPGLDSGWPRTAIDRFVLAKLQENGLAPAPEASRASLIRRLSLDLIGLPPTLAEVKAFIADSTDTAYEKVVDRLLASPHYGERWAGMWLDLSRYADTKGYERDPPREIWQFRDWLIKAFNRDLPFDRFTIEQLAGDLLPDATPDQYLATAFHRNTMNNDEGGTDNEEFRIAAVIDRVNTTWEVWQGTTFGCVQCHSHPYDPFRHEEYYRSFAFFNDTRDEDTWNDTPNLRVYPDSLYPQIERILTWVQAHSQRDKEAVHQVWQLLHITEPKIHPHNCDILQEGTHADTKWLAMYHNGIARMNDVPLSDKDKLMIHYKAAKNDGTIEVRLDSTQGELLLRIDLTEKNKGHFLYDIPEFRGNHDLYLLFRNSTLEKETAICSIDWFMFYEDLPGNEAPEFDEIEETLLTLLNARTPETPVLVENNDEFRRTTNVFVRGNWLVPGMEVTCDVPASLPAMAESAPKNRLGLAEWLVSPENPLTARVAVNRFWEQLFGAGIMETVEDFGTQGSKPTHPQLLDWLAMEFRTEYGWSIKRLLKEIVISATYRQSSQVTTEKLDKDPHNVLLSRRTRVRLSAEQLRDQALAVSGLLSHKMYGPSVMPHQPEGVWQTIYSKEKWTQSKGEDQYRRALYTYWRRTSPYPSMMAFDAPSREFCVSRRIRTNTPLQALVTLNDPVYSEAAEKLAERMLLEVPPDVSIEAKLGYGFRLALAEDADSQTLDVLQRLYDEAYDFYCDNEQATIQMTGGSGEDCARLAAMKVVANSIMNLDQFITNG